MQQPFLIGESIYLRTINESDLNENYQQWFNDAEVCQFNSHHRFPNYRQNMQSYFDEVIKSGNNLILAIIDKGTEVHIGNISLQNIDSLNQSAEFAIIIGNKEFWSRGVGKEAAQLVIEHGFKQLNLHRVYCGTSIENIGMQKLAEALGFVKEGTARDAMFKNGKFQDIISYGLIRHET